jgi:quercetin dioxygenase-like cupin family protein
MSEIDAILGIAHYFSGREYAKKALLQKGMCAQQHVHDYDHLSIFSGHVLVEVDGVAQEYKGIDCLTIAAGKAHKVTALEDSVWFCIHATDETDPEKVDDVILNKVEGG